MGFFESLNAYFDKVYVLTIPSARQRQDQFSLAMHGLKFQFFIGLEKKALLSGRLPISSIYDDEQARKNQRYGKSMTAGEVACAWGHRRIYEDMIANKVNRALVFEDDVFPLIANTRYLEGVLADIPPDWDILFFDYDKNENVIPLKKSLYHLQHWIGLLNWNHTLINNLYPRPVNKHWKTAGYHDFADAYGITLSAAKKLTDLQTPVSMVADNLLANAVTKEYLKGYISLPKLFAQRSAGQHQSIETLVEKPNRQRQ